MDGHYRISHHVAINVWSYIVLSLLVRVASLLDEPSWDGPVEEGFPPESMTEEVVSRAYRENVGD